MLELNRLHLDNCTIGVLTDEKENLYFTLELAWMDNQANHSCIPSGVYEWFKRRSPSKGYQVIELRDVEERSFIQVHAGNQIKDSKGCILVGDSITDFNSDGIPDITNSRKSLNMLLSNCENKGYITII